MTDLQAPLPSPGVGARRRGPVALPRLPLSAFSTPPNSGVSERFPLPQSPSTNHPYTIIDSCLSANNAEEWSTQVKWVTSRNVSGVVLSLPASGERDVFDQFQKSHPSLKILSVIVPISFENGVPADVPKFGEDIRVTLSITFVKSSPEVLQGIRWALKNGHVLDIIIESPGESAEALLELLNVAFGTAETALKPAPGGAIVLSNILPPPHDINLSIVKLLNHPKYHAYKSYIAAFSLYPSVYIKYTPPHWNGPIPPTSDTEEEGKEKKEWKRHIKMFLGPAVEAFGFERIMFGSSRAAGSTSGSANDWYEIARESLVELGVDQESVDAVFAAAAGTVYNTGN
ncbi:hypothetical protein BU17DRAFT_79267 [Hysterangium stoloniferum]|nr:hypothetical protein BU17DRAFT_79267 [Hysterangium stoloniferum]